MATGRDKNRVNAERLHTLKKWKCCKAMVLGTMPIRAIASPSNLQGSRFKLQGRKDDELGKVESGKAARLDRWLKDRRMSPDKLRFCIYNRNFRGFLSGSHVFLPMGVSEPEGTDGNAEYNGYASVPAPAFYESEI